MLSLNHENINYVMTQILKLSCASFSYVNISYVLGFSQFQTQADQLHLHRFVVQTLANTVSYTLIIHFFISKLYNSNEIMSLLYSVPSIRDRVQCKKNLALKKPLDGANTVDS